MQSMELRGDAYDNDYLRFALRAGR